MTDDLKTKIARKAFFDSLTPFDHPKADALWELASWSSLRHTCENLAASALQAIHDAGYDLTKLEDPEALTVADYEEVLADHRRLVKELDRLLNGEGGAERPSLCDVVGQLRDSSFALADLRTHVVVPKEPTEAMLDAAGEAFTPAFAMMWRKIMAEVFARMVSASQPKTGEGT